MYYTDTFIDTHQREKPARLRRLARRRRRAVRARGAASGRLPPAPREIVLDEAPAPERHPVGPRG